MSASFPGSDDQFEKPPEDRQSGDDGVHDYVEEQAEWDQPDEDQPVASENVVASADTVEHGYDSRLLELHRQIEQSLVEHVQSSTHSSGVMKKGVFDDAENIVGVGLGANFDSPADGMEPGIPCVNVYVAEPTQVESVRQTLANQLGVHAATDTDLPVQIHQTGIIDAQPHRFRSRPAPGGVSCGHLRVTAGTLGCLARGRRAPRHRRMLILSNNHVLANSNTGRFGDPILQPGRHDGGAMPNDQIAILERFVPIQFGGALNFVDCATGWAWPDRVRKELVYLKMGQQKFFRISNSVQGCQPGMLVGKSGRTTQITNGRVVDCNATIRVNFPGGRVALFRDQIAIRGLNGNFSDSGDSGSVVWTWNSRRNPVGLLFAGGGGFTFANKMTRVLSALDINLHV